MRVSSCVLVRLLFFESNLIIGSSIERMSHFRAFSLAVSLHATASLVLDTILYTSSLKDLWFERDKCEGSIRMMHKNDQIWNTFA